MTLKTLTAAGAAALMMFLPATAAQDAHALTVRVPLDRAAPNAGQIPLYVRVARAPLRARRTLLYVAGGPGSSATAELGGVIASLGRGFRSRTDVVAFDARGTGRSGVFRCPALQRDRTLRSTSAAAACARQLGRRRGTATVAEQVEDIEAVRAALKIPRLDLLGISYGTEVAQRYAQAYPHRVGRVVLDSVLPPEGPSPLSRELFAGMPRVLGQLCARRRCVKGLPNPAAEVPELVRQLRAAPLRATTFDARGRAREETIGPVTLLDVLIAGDFNPALRQAIPPAVVAARRGDGAPLARLLRLDRTANPPPQTGEFSIGAYAATSCESLELPWDPATDPATRRAQAAQRIAALGDAAFAPFDGQTVLEGDFLPLCLGWPAPVRAPVKPPSALPPVPMLLIAGEEDLRTPLESAREAAARGSATRVLRVGGVGHSVLTADETGCAARAARAFLLRTGGRTPARCTGPDPYVPPVPIAPARVEDLGAARTVDQRLRRTLRAIDATLDDVVIAVSVGGPRGGGLRGGSFAATGEGLGLDRYEYVPGVRVSATPLPRGALRLRFSGPGTPSGTATLRRSGRITGTIGSRSFSGELPAGPPAA